MIVQLMIFATIIYFFGNTILLMLPALILSFTLTDIVSLSQHSHIKMPISNGEDVKPLKYIDQIKYTRSLRFSKVVAKYLLFNFNLHEQHHAYPGLPCYHLPKVDIAIENTFDAFPWLRKVKSMPGVEFVFHSSEVRNGF